MKISEDNPGKLPYRMALAGGWIDQPFVSSHNPSPPGSMVVVSLEPAHAYMERAGMATSTRRAAARLWGNRLPEGRPENLVRELYAAENKERPDPSGSQDMIGLVYPGICRLDYDFAHAGGVFPRRVECTTDRAVADWLERIIGLVYVESRPAGYDPIEKKNLDPEWISRLGRCGKECYAAITSRDAVRLGQSLNECMLCWEAILPGTVRHPALRGDLLPKLHEAQAKHLGAMYSGCGGGYLYVVSEDPVPGALKVKIRTVP